MELWQRERHQRPLWTCKEAHKGLIDYSIVNFIKFTLRILPVDGVYALDLGKGDICVSGGDDGLVKVWSSETGELLHILHHHAYIVWNLKLWCDTLVSCSYDCSIAFLELGDEKKKSPKLTRQIKGPESWADGIAIEGRGYVLATHDEVTFEVTLWNVDEASETKDASDLLDALTSPRPGSPPKKRRSRTSLTSPGRPMTSASPR